MSITGFLKTLTNKNPKQFVAPIIRQRLVVVVQDGIPFKFNVDVQEPGWYLFNPTSKTTAVVDRVALPWERQEFVDTLVPIRVLSLYRVASQEWMAIPFNMSDARQKGWDGHPMTVNLINGAIQSLSVNLCYLFLDGLLHGRVVGPVMEPSNEERLARSLIAEHAREVERLARREQLSKIKASVGDTIEYQLALADANLIEWGEHGNGYRVEWMIDVNGRSVRRTSFIGPNMMCDSVGRCVAGTDRQHSLASAVEIVRYGEGRRRW